jgi:hypothetical protein
MSQLLEIRALPDGTVQARRKDGQPLTDEDRAEVRRLTGRCWKCGEPWSEVIADIYGRRWRVCWRPTCTKSA